MNLDDSFKNGTLPKKLNGFYRGKLEVLYPKTVIERIGNIAFKIWLPWYGKELDTKKNTGLNHVPAILDPIVRARYGDSVILGKTGAALQVFPFKTSNAKGLKDTIKVLRLDYDIPQNPQSIRNIVDELVEIKPGEYLGKAYTKEGKALRLLAFFSLRK